RYVGAVAAGVAVQAVLGLSAGPDLVTFALVARVGPGDTPRGGGGGPGAAAGGAGRAWRARPEPGGW
ncbi:hypothetical protein ACFV5M_31215, partial [Streptomyces albidoflavus]